MKRLLALTQSVRYGGDDSVLLELIRAWPATERWSVAINRSHPGRPIYEEKLAGRADLIILDMPASGEPGAIGALAASRRLKPIIASTGAQAVLVSSGGFPPTTLTLGFLMAARRAGVSRVVLSAHNEPNLGTGLRRLWRNFRGRMSAYLCDAIVSVSKDCAGKISAACGRPVDVIYNGNEDRALEEPAALRRDLGVPEGALIIGAVGNLERRKGFRTLLCSFRRLSERLPQARLVIIGADADPEEAALLRKLAADPAISGRVLLAGYRPNASRYAAAFDVCTIPSLSHESFGLMALDAMREGKAVVATRVGGLPEVVLDGATGLLVAPGDSAALADALERVVADPKLARRLGEAGRARAQEHFSAERMARDYRRVLLRNESIFDH